MRRRLGARDAEQRAHEQPVARGHAEQRAAAGRGGEPVEDGLGLVGRGVAGRKPRAARGGEARAGAEAHVARPGLQVAGVLGPARGEDLERDAELRAQRAAERLVAAGLGAQAVVDVQRAHGAGAREPHRDVEQADRVAPARQQDDDGPAGRQQAGRPDALEQVVRHTSESRSPRS